MINLIMNKNGTRAHIVDGYTTWCGIPGSESDYIPKGTRICPFCWHSVLSQGFYTEEQLISVQNILEGKR